MPIERYSGGGLPGLSPHAIAEAMVNAQARSMFPNAGLPTYGVGCEVRRLEPMLSPVCTSCKDEITEWEEREGPHLIEKYEEQVREEQRQEQALYLSTLADRAAAEKRERLYNSKLSTRIKSTLLWVSRIVFLILALRFVWTWLFE